jgi:hypothetical protein
VEQSFVHAERTGTAWGLVDEQGRRLFLRGVNANGLINYAADYQEAVPLTADDFREMAALGFNLLRLPVSWSRIMPAPGRPARAYLEQIAATVSQAWAEGLYVLVDFHQDNYARDLAPGHESDGAPAWAVVGGRHWNWRMSGNPAVETAFSHFWRNHLVQGHGLQDQYLDGITLVAERLAAHPGVLAYDLMNEPDPGWTLPAYFEARYLFPFYTQAIDRIRQRDRHHAILFEPSVIRDATNVALQCSHPFSQDANLIYGPHCYTEVASPPFHPVGRRRNPCLWACYRTAAWEAQRFGVPWLFGEFGVNPAPAGDGWLRDQMRFQHQFGVGGAFWVWKQQPGFYNWGLVHPDGSLRSDTERAQILAEPRALALPGTHARVRYNPRARALIVTGTVSEHPAAPALLYWSGFVVPSPPVVTLAAASGQSSPPAEVESVSYGPIRGWRIRQDLSRLRGRYRMVMRAP